jgi:SAM-dependent methyltransferase
VTFSWDPTLYAGSAVHYARGRRPYSPALAAAVRDELGLDGTGRLLDVGCGPGSLTTVLAPLFASAVGVDADAGMLAEAARRSPGVEWQQLRAEELPADLGTFRVVSFAQSFHWMDQPVVAGKNTVWPPGANGGEEDVMRAAGYSGPARREIAGETVVRTLDEIVDSVFSLSGSTPHLFGDRREAFEEDLRKVLLTLSPDGRFPERMRESAIVIWRP